jgi:hypothetical protein
VGTSKARLIQQAFMAAVLMGALAAGAQEKKKKYISIFTKLTKNLVPQSA